MKVQTSVLFYFFLQIIFAPTLIASHIRGGEIAYSKTASASYTFYITLYTDDASAADSPFVDLDMGYNAISARADRVSKTPVLGGYSISFYQVSHNFPGNGTYKISFKDNARPSLTNVLNSINKTFYIETILNINPNIVQNTFRVASPAILKTIANQTFRANLTTYSDVSTDSLNFQQYPLWEASGQAIAGYQYPTGLTINNISGEIVWKKPTQAGVFGIAIRITLWRNGTKIATMHRDLTIVVVDAASVGKMPAIADFSSINLDNPNGTQVEVGQNVTFRVVMDKATTPIEGLKLISHLFTALSYDSLNFRVLKFEWTPSVAQKQPYILTFRGTTINAQDLDKTILLYVGYPPSVPSFITALENEQMPQAVVTVFPNPAKDEVHFHFKTEVSNSFITIYDMQNKEVIQRVPVASLHTTIPINKLKKGVYLYKIFNKYTVLRQGKIIKE